MILRVKYQSVSFYLFVFHMSKIHPPCCTEKFQQVIPCVTNMDNSGVKESHLMSEKPYVPDLRLGCKYLTSHKIFIVLT